MKEKEINQSNTELIGILQAISVVAKNLAHRLMRLEEEVKKREEKAETNLRGKSLKR